MIEGRQMRQMRLIRRLSCIRNFERLGLLFLLFGSVRAATVENLRFNLQVALSVEAGPSADWGALVVNAGGREIFGTNSDRMFIPASNTKLFIAALALDRLGNSNTLHTPILATVEPDAAGCLRSDLWIIGQGDPSLGDDPTASAFGESLGALASQLLNRGVRRIEGDLVVCDGALRTSSAGSGWDSEDLIEAYGAPVSGLIVRDNTFRVTVTPSMQIGAPALFRSEPDLPSTRVEGLVQTATNLLASLTYQRDLATDSVRFKGRIPLGSKPWLVDLAVNDAPRYFGDCWRAALLRRGLVLTGTNRVVHSTQGIPSVELVDWTSETLGVRVRHCLKMSQNLQAQLLLVQVGRRFPGGGLESFLSDDAKGLLACPEFFQRAGIKEGSAHFEEGAGLSRANAVSPAATVALLRFMRGHRESVSWMEALPIAGVDGTLKNRFRKSPATGKVRAKTGTLRGVIALGGYVTTAFGEELTFAIYANQASVDPKSRARMDRWVETLAAYNGPLGH